MLGAVMYGIAAKTQVDQNTTTLANWIMEIRPERLAVRDVQRSGSFPRAFSAASTSLKGTMQQA